MMGENEEIKASRLLILLGRWAGGWRFEVLKLFSEFVEPYFQLRCFRVESLGRRSDAHMLCVEPGRSVVTGNVIPKVERCSTGLTATAWRGSSASAPEPMTSLSGARSTHQPHLCKPDGNEMIYYCILLIFNNELHTIAPDDINEIP